MVVYKRVTVESSYVPNSDLHGKPFTGLLKNQRVSGHLSVSGVNLYLCTDLSIGHGAHCSEKFGHCYSWAFDQAVSSIVVDGKEILIKSYKTPYRDFNIAIGETYSANLELIEDGDSYEIGEGIHSFVHLKDATRVFFPTHNKFVKCIIPAGSEYYEGTFKVYPSIASNALYYKEFVNPSDYCISQ